MQAVYHFCLVALSIAVATLVSYTALRLAARVAATEGPASRIWLGIGAVVWAAASGPCISSAMLAMSLPIRLTYAIPTTLGSLVLAMGAGISAMHYMGMAAITIVPAISCGGLRLGVAYANEND